MRKSILLFVTLIFFINSQAQKNSETRLFVNFGAGPSYSLYYNSGGWVRDWGNANTNNITSKRVAWAFSYFAELEWRLKNPRWSIRGGYSMHHFFPAFKFSGTTSNNTLFSIDTKEPDRYIYFQPTVHYALLTGKNRLEIGTGAYIQINKRQGISYYNSYSNGSVPPGPALIIDDYESSEAGFLFNFDYIRTMKSGNGIGGRINFNYTQSVQTAEHLALQIFFKAKLN